MALTRRRIAELQRAARVISQPQSLPPPIKGWNTRDAFEAMDPLDAITLDNWYPDVAGCSIRSGSQVFATTNNVSPVQTLAVWQSGSQSALVAGAGNQLWDVSGGAGSGSPAPPVIGSSYSSDWWAAVNFAERLFLCNGHDGIKVWQGPIVGSGTVTDAGFTIAPASGFDPGHLNTMNGAYVAHERLWFWNGRDPGVWYGQLLAITGVLTYFPFDRLVPTGAAMVAQTTLTYDGGQGINDYTIFILSTGEMLSYRGTDPTDPNNWALVGIYVIAPPVAPQPYPTRGLFRYGGDVYSITSSDYQKMSQLIMALRDGVMPPRSKAYGAVIAAVGLARDLPGWQALYWGFGRRLIFNVPQANGSFQQHVYNPATDAFCRYTGLPAYCWAVWGDRLFFGAPQGYVVEHGVGNFDELAAAARAPIAAKAQQAWNLWQTPLEKRVTAVRPVVQSSLGPASFVFTLGFDYQDPNIVVAVDEVLVGSPWDTSPWGSPWSASFAIDNSWHIAGGNGSAISLMVAATTFNPVTWVRSDLRIEPGTAL